MKKIDMLPVHISLLTVTLILTVWQANVGLRILRDARTSTTEILSRLDDVQRGLATGAIKVDPPKHTKLLLGAVRNWSSSIKEERTEYDPCIELTQILLEGSIGIFVLQLALAIGIPLWNRRRNREAL